LVPSFFFFFFFFFFFLKKFLLRTYQSQVYCNTVICNPERFQKALVLFVSHEILQLPDIFPPFLNLELFKIPKDLTNNPPCLRSPLSCTHFKLYGLSYIRETRFQPYPIVLLKIRDHEHQLGRTFPFPRVL
jgi:hypothetical protein